MRAAAASGVRVLSNGRVWSSDEGWGSLITSRYRVEQDQSTGEPILVNKHAPLHELDAWGNIVTEPGASRAPQRFGLQQLLFELPAVPPATAHPAAGFHFDPPETMPSTSGFPFHPPADQHTSRPGLGPPSAGDVARNAHMPQAEQPPSSGHGPLVFGASANVHERRTVARYRRPRATWQREESVSAGTAAAAPSVAAPAMPQAAPPLLGPRASTPRAREQQRAPPPPSRSDHPSPPADGASAPSTAAPVSGAPAPLAPAADARERSISDRLAELGLSADSISAAVAALALPRWGYRPEHISLALDWDERQRAQRVVTAEGEPAESSRPAAAEPSRRAREGETTPPARRSSHRTHGAQRQPNAGLTVSIELLFAEQQARLEAESRARELEAQVVASTCVVCLDSGSSHVLVPCGHKCVCAECLQQLQGASAREFRAMPCPICQGTVTSAIRVYGC